MTTSRHTRAIPWRLQIIDENKDFLVVNKPPHVQVHPSKPGEVNTLWDGLREVLAFELVNGGQVSIINRLDRETSGLTIVAKSRSAARSLCRQMEQRSISKSYLAIVWGWPQEDEWTVELPLRRQGDFEPSKIYLRQAAHPDGAPSTTAFRVVERYTRPSTNGERFSLVQAFPITGRMHQIRVHLASSGHPLIGDKIYGPDPDCYLEFIETGWTARLEEQLLVPRHALHSATLRLEESSREWQSALPPDLAEFLRPAKVAGNLLVTGKPPIL